jgi:hypothetical protein
MNQNKKQAKKQTYHSPQVRDYGNIREITANNNVGGPQADNQSSQRKT